MVHSAEKLSCNWDASLRKISVQSVLGLISLKLQQSLALKLAIAALRFVGNTHLEEAITHWPFKLNNRAVFINHPFDYVLQLRKGKTELHECAIWGRILFKCPLVIRIFDIDSIRVIVEEVLADQTSRHDRAWWSRTFQCEPAIVSLQNNILRYGYLMRLLTLNLDLTLVENFTLSRHILNRCTFLIAQWITFSIFDGSIDLPFDADAFTYFNNYSSDASSSISTSQSFLGGGAEGDTFGFCLTYICSSESSLSSFSISWSSGSSS